MQLCDNQARNALFYARNSNSTECCQLLIHNGCLDVASNNTFPNGNTPASNTSNQNTFSRKLHSSTSYIGGISNFTQGAHFDKIPYNVT